MFLTKFRLLLGKIETNYGEDPTPTVGANAIDAKNIKINYSGDLLERDTFRSTLSPRSPIMGKRWIDISFDVELKGSGSLGVAGQLSALLQACGFSETASVGSSVMYAPASTGIKSVALYCYDIADTGNCRLHKMLGARGTVSFKCDAGTIGTASFKLQALYAAMTDVSAPGAPTFETTKPPVVQGCTFSLNSVSTLVAQSVSLDMANEVTPQDDIASAGAIKAFIITGRKPAGQFNPEAVLAATHDFNGDWAAATQRAMVLTIGSAVGNKITFSAPKVTPNSLADGDKNGILTNEVPFRMGQSADAGNDELTIKFE